MLKELLPINIYNILTDYVNLSTICELRIRVDKNLSVKTYERKFIVDYQPTKNDLEYIIQIASRHSLYAYEDDIKKGFIRYKGIRIGLIGEGVTNDMRLLTIKNFTTLVIRLPHQIVGIADRFNFFKDDFQNTLVISPPYGGKTTLIRDIARILSYHYDTLIIDEREEIWSNSFDFGPNVEVFTGCPKEMIVEGIIRSTSPQIIVLDELFQKSDLSVLGEIQRCGIGIVASVHGNGIDELKKFSPELLSYFNLIITLSNKPKVGSIKSVIRL